MTTPHPFVRPATTGSEAAETVRLCRFRRNGEPRIAIGIVTADDRVVDLTGCGIAALADVLDTDDPAATARAAAARATVALPLHEVVLLPPVERQEVWAAGVTYLRSKTARMEESDFSATAYDRVYDAARPEIFFKALGEKVVGPADTIGIRGDARWNVPEPELALVMNAAGRLVGGTIGNDMSSRDIEGENLLYLPQAKVYDRSCALGPWIVLGADEAMMRSWAIAVSIARAGTEVFAGSTSVDRIRRSFTDLTQYLWRSQSFPHGVVLLTGTGVVPDESFTLAADDRVTITVDGIGRLENTVVVV